MKKIVLSLLYFITLLIMLILIFKATLNTILLNKYKKAEYSETIARNIEFPSVIKDYIAAYNYGNVLYNKGDYRGAIVQYDRALASNPPEKKECSIRINYALAICKTVNVNENNVKSIKNAIQKYELAIDILTEKGCANKNDDNGHSKEAEQLKKDIQKEIDRLKELLKDKDEEQDEEESQEDEEETTSTDERESDSVEEKIQKTKEDAIKKQRSMEDQNSNFKTKFTIKNKNW